MRVMLAVHGYPPELDGGTERHVEGLATGLIARGHDVTVLAGTLEWRERLVESAQRTPVPLSSGTHTSTRPSARSELRAAPRRSLARM